MKKKMSPAVLFPLLVLMLFLSVRPVNAATSGFMSPEDGAKVVLGKAVTIEYVTGYASNRETYCDFTVYNPSGTIVMTAPHDYEGMYTKITETFLPTETGTYTIKAVTGVYSTTYSFSGGIQRSYTSKWASIIKTVSFTVVKECTSHSYGAWKVTKEPTFTATGTKERTCTVCGHKETGKVAKLKAKKGLKLSNCEAAYKLESDLKSVTYTAPADKSVTAITIPATVKLAGRSFKVTGIAKNAFAGCAQLEKVVIGKNVKTIGKKAFYGCSALKTIQIKTSKLTLKKVGAKAFKGISADAVIKVPKKKLKAYKKILKKRGIGKKVKVK